MSALRLLLAVSGLIVWSSAFVVLYAALSLGCAARLDQQTAVADVSVLTLVLAGLWLAHLAVLGGLQWYALSLWRVADGPDADTRKFLAATTCLVSASGLFATVFVGFPLVVLPPCV